MVGEIRAWVTCVRLIPESPRISSETAIATSSSPPRVVRFSVFEVDLSAGELRKNGLRHRLVGQPFQLLQALLERPGEVVTRDELRQRIWPENTFVDYELALKKAVNRLREVLGDSADSPRFIETVPRRGYRFVGGITIPPLGLVETGELHLTAADGLRNVLRQLGTGLPRNLIIAFSLAVLGALLLWFNAGKLRTRIFARSPSSPIHSIAVLPLENLTSDPEQEYFSDGMTDELITDLAKIQSLRVISRNSVMPYKGKHKPVSEIGRELNVDAVVEGTVMRSGNRVRIRAQLIEAQTDRHLWAQAYEGDVRDVLKLQDQVAQAIATEIKGRLAPEEKVHLTSSKAVNPDAHEADLRGFYELHKHGAAGTFLPAGNEIENAVKFFQQALSIDPDDALAYAGLAAAYYDQSTFFRAPSEVMPKAKAAAAKAIELDDSLAEAHASLGYVKLTFDWDWSGAGQEFHRALELNPNLASGHAGYAHYLLTLGRSEEAILELGQLKNVDPLFPQSHVGLPYTLWNLRLYEEAVEAAKKENDERVVALSRIEQGRNEEAVAAADRGMRVARNPVILAQFAYVYARAGMKAKARTILKRLEAEVKRRYVCGFNVACLYVGLNDKEQAYAWLERAYRDRSD